MQNQKEKIGGVPSVPRNQFPSMFQILSWNGGELPLPQVQLENKVSLVYKLEESLEPKPCIKEQQRQSIGCSTKQKNIPKETKYELYQYENKTLRRSQSENKINNGKQKNSKENQSKPKTIKKKLSESNEYDRKEIQKRKERIKQFEYVTRDLPNSSYVTYFGKPAFEAYGRGTSNPNLKTFNVMPHKGENHPKNLQSDYTALIKGKKIAKSSQNFIPRKPFQPKQAEDEPKQQEDINIPMEKPDLVNNIRFADQQAKDKTMKIPSNKVSSRKSKVDKKKPKAKKNAMKKQEAPDGLKFMNIRTNLLNILESKRMNSSKLAYKITECYPYNWMDQQRLKESRLIYNESRIAGKPRIPEEKVADLMRDSQIV